MCSIPPTWPSYVHRSCPFITVGVPPATLIKWFVQQNLHKPVFFILEINEMRSRRWSASIAILYLTVNVHILSIEHLLHQDVKIVLKSFSMLELDCQFHKCRPTSNFVYRLGSKMSVRAGKSLLLYGPVHCYFSSIFSAWDSFETDIIYIPP